MLRSYAEPGTFTASSLWQTSPVDCPPESGDFINAAVGFVPRADLTPEGLLVELKTLEKRYGRGRAIVKNAPRELDLDLLVFGQNIRDTEYFVLPHPRATQRRFVLAPVVQIAPDWVWPGQNTGQEQTVAELLANLESDEHVVCLG